MVKNTLTHTLNGSSLAVGRTLLGYYGKLSKRRWKRIIPEVLKPYMEVGS